MISKIVPTKQTMPVSSKTSSMMFFIVLLFRFIALQEVGAEAPVD